MKCFGRIAWYDREQNKYDFGSWHEYNSSKIFDSLKWVNNNNIAYSKTFYWLEIKDEEGAAINVEYYLDSKEKEYQKKIERDENEKYI